MSDAVFLDPVGPDKRTLFVQVRNTSDQPSFTIEPALKAAIAGKGYRIVDDPDTAPPLNCKRKFSVSRKLTRRRPQAALKCRLRGRHWLALYWAERLEEPWAVTRGLGIGAGAGGLVGGLAETVANAMVKDVLFVAITDIQISQKTKEGVSGTQKTKADLAQGTGTKVEQEFEEVVKQKKYRTRVMSTANQVNLEYEDAAPRLNAGLTRVLAGLF